MITGMDRSRYVFRSRWRLDAPPGAVYEALRDVASYPDWWPQVRDIWQLADGAARLRCRSVLPYDLVFEIHREIEDPDGRVLQARQVGDLEGTSRWTVGTNGAGTVALFDQEVVVRKSLIRRVGLLARPILMADHDVMMREGERGLRRYLDAREGTKRRRGP